MVNMPELNVTFNSSTASVDVWDGFSTAEVKPKGDIYSVSKASELAWIAEQVNSGNNFSGRTVRLMSNIDLGDKIWKPIGSENNRFDGLFDGQTNSVMNIRTQNSTYTGLFGAVDDNGRIVKLGMKGTFKIVSDSEVYAGAITGVNHGTIEDCFNACSIFTDIKSEENSSVGGIAGVNFKMISNCFNDADMVSSSPAVQMGGLAGVNNGIIEECYNEGKVSSQIQEGNLPAGVSIYSGGMSGISHGFIGKCYNEGIVESSLTSAETDYAELFAGGICGWSDGHLNDCYNLKGIKAVINIESEKEMLTANAYAGGISGWNSGIIEKCYNENEVRSVSRLSKSGAEESYSGGIVGINLGNVHQSRTMGKAYAESSTDTNAHVHSITGKNDGSITDSF